MSRELIIGVTGASGAPVAVSLLQALLRSDQVSRIHLIFSDYALPVMAQELQATGLDASGFVQRYLDNDRRISLWKNDNLAAPIASGSYRTDGMVIVPCSVNTLAAVAAGLADRLMTRAADVVLKERRPLLMAIRETPLSGVHLENMLRVTRNGALIFPICPAFYANPASVQETVDNFVLRLLDHLDLPADRGFRWGTPSAGT